MKSIAPVSAFPTWLPDYCKKSPFPGGSILRCIKIHLENMLSKPDMLGPFKIGDKHKNAIDYLSLDSFNENKNVIVKSLKEAGVKSLRIEEIKALLQKYKIAAESLAKPKGGKYKTKRAKNKRTTRKRN
jgi:hypothetical protein